MTTTMQLISKQTVGAGGAASVSFSNIPQTYTDLKLVMSARSLRTSDAGGADGYIQFNGDTASNYSALTLYKFTSSAASGTNTVINTITSDNAQTSNTFGNGELYIANYTNSNKKSTSGDFVTENNSTTQYSILTAGLWQGTAPITSILISDTYGGFTEFSTFYLYGISNSTTTQATTVPYASGGDVITTDGTYWYHTFVNSGSFTPLKVLSTDILSVGAGGGGGTSSGGGGGGGEIDAFANNSLTANTVYAVTIGAGGAGSTSDGAKGSNGGTSSFSSLVTSLGGGGGGAVTAGLRDGANGGSGGGASGRGSGGNGGTASGSNTFAGGTADGTSSRAAGGGGATAAGSNYLSTGGTGNGGAGYTLTSLSSYLTSSNISLLSGMTVISSGGGGGGASAAGTGGTGAGNGASSNSTGGNATSFGSGGGGGGGTTFGAGGNGYAGLIIVRYAV